MVSSVVGYNRAITDYILSVRQDIVQPQRLSSVLIGKKATQAAMERARNTNNTSIASTGRTRAQTVSTTIASQTPEPDVDNDFKTPSSTFSSPASQPGSGQSLSTTRPQNQSFKAAKKQSWDYGPTPDSAAAANFDPSNLKTESPVAQAKSTSSTYDSNPQSEVRSASNIRPPRTGFSGAQGQLSLIHI